MAERLTKKIVKTIQDKYSLGNYLYYDFAEIDDTNKLLNKLGKLEDILEEYGIESLEELIRHLSYTVEYDVIAKLEYEKDTWKKACELACDDLGLYEDVTTTQLKMKCYYQQAKKEGDRNEK